ncbi:hypothetical protein TELCIR_19956 [Teladorsagia circumcincta]|uniref:glucuronosyltransferase n=1 Tax=Teladorsagia circumcincta TaxID=45464 RepID=A0A2G9TKS9_TELCI|nr:hypothetical protein TELCIR_19956 [Teladorsagia circumcincta]
MNTNEFTESTRPTLLSIGHEFERNVSKGRKGVILFSLGSLVKSSDMPVAVRRADGRVKLLITHAGMNSVQEAIHFGVPMVTVPLFADQLIYAASSTSSASSKRESRRDAKENQEISTDIRFRTPAKTLEA